MDLAEYTRVLRAHWRLIAVSTFVCVVAAAALAWTRTPLYATDTQFFVSTDTADPADIYTGGLFSQQRIQSYAQLVTSPTVLRRVIADLTLPYSSGELASRIRVSVPADTVLINVTITDESPPRARDIARALGKWFSGFVADLESQRTGRSSPVKVVVTSPPQLPGSPASPKKTVYLVLGALGGLILGIVGAVFREVSARSRVPTPIPVSLAPTALPAARRPVEPRGQPSRDPYATAADDVSAIVDAPVLGTVSESNGRMAVNDNSPSSGRAAAYRLLQANVLAVAGNRGPRSFAVTSAVSSEGKTVVAARLAAAFADAGHRVILVDANVHHPTLTNMLGLASSIGLADVLSDGVPLDTALHSWKGETPLSDLRVLSTGRALTDLSALFDFEQLAALLTALRNRADVVLLDSPALLEGRDAQLLSSSCAGAILVTRPSSTGSKKELQAATASLRAANASIIGVIVNQEATTAYAI